jgi:hypothetical protein
MSNEILPLFYAYLLNKKYRTYLTLFELIKKNLNIDPISISVDFEKAVFNAVFNLHSTMPKMNEKLLIKKGDDILELSFKG